MNKKFLGISALLALILSSCGGTPSVDPSGSSVEPTTSETSSEGGSDSGTSATSEEQIVTLNEILDKIIAVGENVKGIAKVGGVEHKLYQNANYFYVEGFGGIGRIDLVAPSVPEEDPEGAYRDTTIEEYNEEMNAKLASYFGEGKGLEAKQNSFAKKASLNKKARVNEGEPTAAKYFRFDEAEGGFAAHWGAVYSTVEEYLEDSIVAIAKYLKGFEGLDKLFNYSAKNKFYQSTNESVVAILGALAGLEGYINLAKVNLGLDENGKFYIDFYQSGAEAAPSVHVTLEAAGEADKAENLEAWLGSFTEYPTSPISFEDMSSFFILGNFVGNNDVEEMFGVDLSSTDIANEDGYVIKYDGAYYNNWWKNYAQYGAGKDMATGVVRVTEEGKAVAPGNYLFGTPAGAAKIDRTAASSQASSYEDKAHFNYFKYALAASYTWDYAMYSPVDFAYIAATPVEENESFKFTGAAATTYANYSALDDIVYDVSLDIADPDADVSLVSYLRADEISFSYTTKVIEEEGEEPYEMVDEITVTIGYRDFGGQFDFVKGAWVEAPTWLGTYVYELEEVYGEFFNENLENLASQFVNTDLENVTFNDDIKESFELDVEGSEDWNVLPTPTDVAVSYESNDEEIATIDENGKVTAVKPGETVVYAIAGGAVAKARVTVRGLEIGDGSAQVKLAPGAEETYGLHLYGIEGDISASTDKEGVVEATVIPANEQEGAGLKVKVLTMGEVDVTVSVAVGEKVYNAKLHVVATPSVSFAKANEFIGPEEVLPLDVEIIAPEETEIAVTSSDEAVATVSKNGDTGLYEVLGVAVGCVTIKVEFEVEGEKYSDSLKLSVTNNEFVSLWEDQMLGGTILLHEDKTVVYTLADEEETVINGTWAAAKGAEDADLNYRANITLENEAIVYAGESTYKVTYITTPYDTVTARLGIVVTYPAEEEGGEPEVVEDWSPLDNLEFPEENIQALRGDWYTSLDGISFDLYITNDLAAHIFIDDAYLGTIQLPEELEDRTNFGTVKQVQGVNADGFATKSLYQVVWYNATYGFVLFKFTATEATKGEGDYGDYAQSSNAVFRQYDLY